MGTEKYIRIQEGLRGKIVLEDGIPEKIKRVAGVDQSFPEKNIVRSCIVVLSFPGLVEIERAFSETKTEFPYIPGLLAFREGPGIVEAYGKLKEKPDVLIVDGHGIAHPRRVGIATHVGILLDIATIGVAKRRLIGEFDVPEKVGDYTLLRDGGEIVGVILKSRKGCNPIFISPGHRISLYTSMLIVEKCLKGHKLPEPTRLAHELAGMY
jgi:deoxyribonuclease V